MPYPQTPLEQTHRHVIEGERRIDKQEALIERLEQGGEEREMVPAAKEFLEQMHDFQKLGQEHLEREKAKEF